MCLGSDRPTDEEAVRVLSSSEWSELRADGPRPRGVVVVNSDALPRPELHLPAVGGIQLDLLRDGDRVEIDGDAGTLVVKGAEEAHVVTAFLEREDGRILLLRRSDRVGSFRGRWAGVSGFLERSIALEQAHVEVEEETGLPRSELLLRAAGSPVLVREPRRIYIVHPFRFAVRRPSVHLDWEHTDAEWVDPTAILERSTVPKLWEAWESVAPRGPEAKANPP